MTRRYPIPSCARRLAALPGLALVAALSLAPGGASGTQVPPQLEAARDPAATATRLRSEADRYRQLARHWKSVAGGGALQPGDRGKRVAQLRQLLKLYGDYSGVPGPLAVTVTDPRRYDSGLQRAVENYQRRHGLEPSGTANATTLNALAVPPAERARQLELNAARWDKLRLPESGRYVLVNVPAYRLLLVEDGKLTLSMKTVVGKGSSRTPTLRSRITNIIFNPTWTVPRSILLTQLLPKARDNPKAMHQRGYRVVRYGSGTTAPISSDSLALAASGEATLRQLSGPGNALGRVKFVIPNDQAIFLHDTQARSLFGMYQRAFSHGCIRLEKPRELAYALLAPQGWDRTRIARATTGDEQLNIQVERPPRLVISYITAWVDDAGRVQFRPDIYHRDDDQ